MAYCRTYERCRKKPISEALHKVIINVWSTRRVPAEWKEGIIVSLYKGKGSQCECSSYRPISLLSVSGKVFLSHRHQLYADDAVLFTDDPTKWDYVFRNFEASLWVSTQTGIKRRSKILELEMLHIDNQAVDSVSNLGSDIDSEGYSYPEIHRR